MQQKLLFYTMSFKNSEKINLLLPMQYGGAHFVFGVICGTPYLLVYCSHDVIKNYDSDNRVHPP